jgi:hypothetical protein
MASWRDDDGAANDGSRRRNSASRSPHAPGVIVTGGAIDDGVGFADGEAQDQSDDGVFHIRHSRESALQRVIGCVPGGATRPLLGRRCEVASIAAPTQEPPIENRDATNIVARRRQLLNGRKRRSNCESANQSEFVPTTKNAPA